MARVHTSRRAQLDIDQVYDYIADDNPAAADDWVDEVKRISRMLAESPLAGRERESLARGVRSFALGSYLIFYRITQDGIELTRVIHGARNIEDLL
jgi:toxin ParE1/3/4